MLNWVKNWTLSTCSNNLNFFLVGNFYKSLLVCWEGKSRREKLEEKREGDSSGSHHQKLLSLQVNIFTFSTLLMLMPVVPSPPSKAEPLVPHCTHGWLEVDDALPPWMTLSLLGWRDDGQAGFLMAAPHHQHCCWCTISKSTRSSLVQPRFCTKGI